MPLLQRKKGRKGGKKERKGKRATANEQTYQRRMNTVGNPVNMVTRFSTNIGLARPGGAAVGLLLVLLLSSLSSSTCHRVTEWSCQRTIGEGEGGRGEGGLR